MSCIPTVAITMGDPAGIGPEVVLRAVAELRGSRDIKPMVLGDRGVLEHVAGLIGVEPPEAGQIIELSSLDVASIEPGTPSRACGRAMIDYVKEAVRGCLEGTFHAMVTAPINKLSAAEAGFGFPGHTEFIAHLTDTESYAMMFVADPLKVVLATIHTPFRRVPALISRDELYRTIVLSHRALSLYFGIDKPSIAVCGLNPHAGEGGLFGTDEADTIEPAIELARREGIEATGPYPADTLFMRAFKGEFHCVIALYHDQGLIPVKLIAFDRAVNVTIGLPIIRTSVDHGTAYQIAWKGVADHRNMLCAIELAGKMAAAKAEYEKHSNKGRTGA